MSRFLHSYKYQNKYRCEEYPTCLEIILMGAAITAVLSALLLMAGKITTYIKGELDCSVCHSADKHETKRTIEYLEKQGYKEPKKWLK